MRSTTQRTTEPAWRSDAVLALYFTSVGISSSKVGSVDVDIGIETPVRSAVTSFAGLHAVAGSLFSDVFFGHFVTTHVAVKSAGYPTSYIAGRRIKFLK